MRRHLLILPIALTLGAATADAQTERRTLDGDHVALYNLVGNVRVERGSGSAVTVEITRGGRDADRLRIESGSLRGYNTLRVIYPDDEIVYARDDRDSRDARDARDTRNDRSDRNDRRDGDDGHWWERMGRGWNGSVSNVRIYDDGTWGEGRSGERGAGRGRTVSIRRDGRGMEAWADIRVLVPDGRAVDVNLGVGALVADRVDGDLRLDLMSGSVATADTRGALHIDTGSGRVEVRGMRGDNLNVDTGSGSVVISGVNARRCTVDTGSGAVSGDGLECEDTGIDTGSGSITMDRVGSARTKVETGSGSVRLQLTRAPTDLYVDTGSGGVVLTMPSNTSARVDIDTGSGGIETDFAVQTTRVQRNRLVGTIGDGAGRIRVETGSGGVSLRRGTGTERDR